MKKGFTLIELLAVIVILAIIALIASPIVISIIGNARISSDKLSINSFIDSANIKLASKMLKNEQVPDGTYEITSNGNICLVEILSDKTCSNELIIDYDGKRVESGHIIIKNGSVDSIKDVGLGDYVYSGTKDDLTSVSKNTEGLDIIVDGEEEPEPTPEKCFEFDNSTKTITGYNDSQDGCPLDVVIPSKINGKDVVVIGDSSFWDKKITSLIIPSTVKTIEDFAFLGNELISLEIPYGIETIGIQAFSSNTLKNVRLSSSIKIIDYHAFETDALESVYIDIVEPASNSSLYTNLVGNDQFEGFTGTIEWKTE